MHLVVVVWPVVVAVASVDPFSLAGRVWGLREVIEVTIPFKASC